MNIFESAKPVSVPAYEEQVQQRKEKGAARRKKCLRSLALYLDDLLLIAGGICFVGSAGLYGGAPAALGTSGVCLVLYAILVARSGMKKR